MPNYYSPVISEETFAAWLDGTMSYEQETAFLETCSNNEYLQELLDANDQVEEDYENFVEYGYELPYELDTDFEIPEIVNSNDDEDFTYDSVEPYEQADQIIDGLEDNDVESGYYDGDDDSLIDGSAGNLVLF